MTPSPGPAEPTRVHVVEQDAGGALLCRGKAARATPTPEVQHALPAHRPRVVQHEPVGEGDGGIDWLKADRLIQTKTYIFYVQNKDYLVDNSVTSYSRSVVLNRD